MRPLDGMLMIRVKVSLQISRGIFVNGEILQMHTIHESNYTVIKLPSNGNSSLRRKIISIKQFSLHNYQAQLMGRMHLIIFTQINHS